MCKFCRKNYPITKALGHGPQCLRSGMITPKNSPNFKIKFLTR